MNADHFKAKWSQFKGELKRQWGSFTDDDLLQIEGNYDKFVGRTQERYADRKDEVARWADQWFKDNETAGTGGRIRSLIGATILAGMLGFGTTAVAAPGVYQSQDGFAGLQETTAAPTYVVNKDQFQGNWKQFKGELKKQWGAFTDDDLMQIEGDMDKFEGKIQERYGDRKEEVKEWTDEWFKKQKHSGAKTR
jgi:uncharacterized protein YjbJ (UPF0337 family)